MKQSQNIQTQTNCFQMNYPKIDQIKIRSVHYYKKQNTIDNLSIQQICQNQFRNTHNLSTTHRRTTSLAFKANQKFEDFKKTQTSNRLTRIRPSQKDLEQVYQMKNPFCDLQYNQINDYLSEKQEPCLMNKFLHNDDIKLKNLESTSRYKMTIAADINKYENDKIYINYLAGHENTLKYLETYIPDLRKNCASFINEKEKLRQEIKQLHQNIELEIEQDNYQLKNSIKKLHKAFQHNTTNTQNGNFNIQKEITKESRDIKLIDQDIQDLQKKIVNLELQLYDEEVYNLNINDEYILNMTEQNLRPSNQKHIKKLYH